MAGEGSRREGDASVQVLSGPRPVPVSTGPNRHTEAVDAPVAAPEAASAAAPVTAPPPESFTGGRAADPRSYPGAYAQGPSKPRGETRASFSAETWVAGPEAFIFRCQDPRRGDRWTFCVSRTTLQELDPTQPFKPVAAFDALRARIHSAASARMRVADPLVQQVLSAYDIRYARTGARKDESKNEGRRQR